MLTNPVIAVCYNRNAGLTLDSDFSLMLRREARRLSFSVETRSSQAHVEFETQSY